MQAHAPGNDAGVASGGCTLIPRLGEVAKRSLERSERERENELPCPRPRLSSSPYFRISLLGSSRLLAGFAGSSCSLPRPASAPRWLRVEADGAVQVGRGVAARVILSQ